MQTNVILGGQSRESRDRVLVPVREVDGGANEQDRIGIAIERRGEKRSSNSQVQTYMARLTCLIFTFLVIGSTGMV